MNDEDPLLGVARLFEFEQIPCPSCSGRAAPHPAARCANCEGHGRLWRNDQGHTLSDNGLRRLDRIHRGPE